LGEKPYFLAGGPEQSGKILPQYTGFPVPKYRVYPISFSCNPWYFKRTRGIFRENRRII
jgi:hypothetical protein